MSSKPSIVSLPTHALAPASQLVPDTVSLGDEPGAAAPSRPLSREGRKQIAGFFTPEMSFAMHMLARRQGRSLQSLMAEAFNDVLSKNGERPLRD